MEHAVECGWVHIAPGGKLGGRQRLVSYLVGYTQLSLAQLKILQEVITLGVFVPFAVFYMRQPLRWDYLWAALCILGAVYFMFRGTAPA